MQGVVIDMNRLESAGTMIGGTPQHTHALIGGTPQTRARDELGATSTGRQAAAGSTSSVAGDSTPRCAATPSSRDVGTAWEIARGWCLRH